MVGLIAMTLAAMTARPAVLHSQQPAANAMVERGKYLVGITGCHDCHSPKTTG
jgi:hypothetical protein